MARRQPTGNKRQRERDKARKRDEKEERKRMRRERKAEGQPLGEPSDEADLAGEDAEARPGAPDGDAPVDETRAPAESPAEPRDAT